MTYDWFNGLDFAVMGAMLTGFLHGAIVNLNKQLNLFHASSFHPKEAHVLPVSPSNPKTTILIPVLNEPIEVVKETLLAAARQAYGAFEIVLLIDDKPNTQAYSDMQKASEEVNRELGIEKVKTFCRWKYSNILNRDKNKAGVINAFLSYGMGKSLMEVSERDTFRIERAPSGTTSFQSFMDSEYITIIDADYKLDPFFLAKTVAIAQTDKRVAVVQTPQNLVPKNPYNEVEKLGALITNTSWRTVNKGVAAKAGIYWGGTAGLVRVRALEEVAETDASGKVDFITTRNITEDVYMTMVLFQKGWKTEFLPEILAEGIPAASLGEHMAQYWRYAEGHIETTIQQTIPAILRGKIAAFSYKAFDYLMKGIAPLYGLSLIGFSILPILAILGVSLPAITTSVFVVLFGMFVVSTAAAARVSSKQAGGKNFDHLNAGLMMALHSPVFVHSLISAIKNTIIGKRAAFIRTEKTGERTRIPFLYLAPTLTITAANLVTGIGSLIKYDPQTADWFLTIAGWAGFNCAAITYGLIKFNGAKNTLLDFWYGLKISSSKT